MNCYGLALAPCHDDIDHYHVEQHEGNDNNDKYDKYLWVKSVKSGAYFHKDEKNAGVVNSQQ